MRIRKQARGNPRRAPPSDASTFPAMGSQPRRQELASSSGVPIGSQHRRDELVSISRGLKEKTDADTALLRTTIDHSGSVVESSAKERVDDVCASRADHPPSWLEKLHYTKGFVIPPEAPYMNLDEFVSSLARKNCFPAEELISTPSVDPNGDKHSPGKNRMIDFSLEQSEHEPVQHESRREVAPGGSSMLINFSLGQSEHEPVQHESGREVAPGGSSMNHAAPFLLTSAATELDTSFRFSINLNDTTSVLSQSASKQAPIRNLDPGQDTIEARGQTFQATLKTSIVEPTEMEIDDSQLDKHKSPTKGMERRLSRHRRVSSSTGRKRGRLVSSPAAFHEEQTDDTTEETSSDYSLQRVQSRRPKKRALVSVSSSTLASYDSEKMKQEVVAPRPGLGSPTPITTQKDGQSKKTRSGRPKKLKYMKQENVEELGNKCNRSDGKGWTCPLLAKTGYQLCDHHLDKLRCKPGSRSKYNKKKKN